jgi:L-ascorbate metabolism protein UlaG (beta-lactamase superfamily)
MKRIGNPRSLLVLLRVCIVLSFLAGVAGGQSVPGGLAYPCTATGNPDFDDNGTVDFVDFSLLAQHWGLDEPSVDLVSGPFGDGIVAFSDLAVLTAHWLADTSPLVHIQWLEHASVKIWTDDVVVYVDPRNLGAAPHDATVVLVTHTHSDHFSSADIARVWSDDTVLVGPPDVISSYGSGRTLAPDQTLELAGMSVTGVPAYNLDKPNHPRASNWLGYIVQIGTKRIYCAGDTDLTEEMKALQAIDVAILPAGGTYSMDAQQAAEATAYMKPQLAIPYHWGDFIGTQRDAEAFARFAACEVKIMARNEILSSNDWDTEFSLVAHWPLDGSEGDLAIDSAGSAHGTLNGTPHWLPLGGAIGGAVQLDGQENYISVPGVLNPSEGPFSVFAWIKGGLPGEVILAQISAANWLGADAPAGYLGTELRGSGRNSAPLSSQTTITDGDWHRVGLVWDGAERTLYVDDAEVARDAQSNLNSSDAGLYIGAGAHLELDRLWSGLIDDVRIYLRAIAPP